MNNWSWSYVGEIMPDILKGLWITIQATIYGSLVSFALGLVWAVALRSRSRWVTWPVSIFVEFIRNTPLLVQLFFLFFVLRETRACQGDNEDAREKERESGNRRMGEWANSPFRCFSDSPIHSHYCGASSWIRRRSASASAVFPMRRSHCSRSLNATSDSLISIERVCDATAPAKSARCRSRVPRKNQMFEL